jgi:hypothetical protein
MIGSGTAGLFSVLAGGAERRSSLLLTFGLAYYGDYLMTFGVAIGDKSHYQTNRTLAILIVGIKGL